MNKRPVMLARSSTALVEHVHTGAVSTFCTGHGKHCASRMQNRVHLNVQTPPQSKPQ